MTSLNVSLTAPLTGGRRGVIASVQQQYTPLLLLVSSPICRSRNRHWQPHRPSTTGSRLQCCRGRQPRQLEVSWPNIPTPPTHRRRDAQSRFQQHDGYPGRKLPRTMRKTFSSALNFGRWEVAAPSINCSLCYRCHPISPPVVSFYHPNEPNQSGQSIIFYLPHRLYIVLPCIYARNPCFRPLSGLSL